MAAEFQHRVGIGQGLDELADVVHPQTVLGHNPAQQPLVGALPVGNRALEVGQIFPGHPDGLGLIPDCDIDHSVSHLDIQRPDLFRAEDAEAAALNHGRTAHADVGALGGNNHVTAAQNDRIAGKAAARGHSDQRHQPAQSAPQVKGHHVQPRGAGPVGIAGPSAAALGKEHDRPFPLFGQLEHPVFFVVVLKALGAGQHGIVIGQHDAPGALVVKQRAVDAADAGDQAVGRRVCDQVVERTALPLGGNDQRAVLDKRVRVAQVGDILAAGALAGLAPAGDRLGTGGVKPDRVSFNDLGQVGADVGKIDRCLFLDGGRIDLTLFDKNQGVALIDRIALSHRDTPHNAAQLGLDDVLHLHGFEDEQLPAGVDRLALVDIEADDCALHGRCHRTTAGQPDSLKRRFRHRCRGARWWLSGLFAKIQHCQGVAGVKLCPCQCGFQALGGCSGRRKKQVLMGLLRRNKVGDMIFHKARVDLVGHNIGVLQHIL